MKKGFTLVELSIVLVIIGLLIGGILVGQSLIESAKINKFVNLLTQYDIAYDGFKAKYKQIPGDSSLFPVTGYTNPRTRENDGKILPVSGSSAGSFTYEVAAYWKHLYQAGMIPKDYSDTATTGIRAGVNVPSTPFPGTGLLAGTYATGMGIGYEQLYFIGDTSATTNNFNYNEKNFATPTMAMAIDNKLDDGKAYPDLASSLTGSYNGRFVKLYWSSRSSTPCTVTDGAGNPQSQDFSMVNSDQKNCVLMYTIGSSR